MYHVTHQTMQTTMTTIIMRIMIIMTISMETSIKATFSGVDISTRNIKKQRFKY